MAAKKTRAKTTRKKRPPAGTVTITVTRSTQKMLELELQVERAKGKPETVPLQIEGAAALRVFAVLNDPSVLNPDWKPTLNTDPKKAPKVGDVIYVRTSLYIDHGQDDVVGGLAHVTEVKGMISAGQNVPCVSTLEHPGRGYNWEMLAGEQEKLAREFGTRWAYPDPER